MIKIKGEGMISNGFVSISGKGKSYQVLNMEIRKLVNEEGKKI